VRWQRPGRIAAKLTQSPGDRRFDAESVARPDARDATPGTADLHRARVVRRTWLRRHLGRGDRRAGEGLQAGRLRALRRQGRALRGRGGPGWTVGAPAAGRVAD